MERGMLTDHERYLVVSYLAKAAARLHHRDRADALAECVIENAQGRSAPRLS